jgi:catechol 2,3-dioxygenase-like lactoylglutathione lyase family enzyme
MKAAIRGLDHWAIVTKNLSRCVAFYEHVLGLQVGPRPKLTFEGVWLYAGDYPIVHVISDRDFQSGPTGAFDHIAFAMDGSPSEMEHALTQADVAFQSRLIERTGIYQIACKDPDGCGVELNFQGVAADQAKAATGPAGALS